MSQKRTTNDLPVDTTQENAPEKPSRRSLFLRGGAAAGGLAVFGAGYKDTLVKGAKGLVDGTSGVPTASATRGNSLQTEYHIDPKTGEIEVPGNQVVAMSSCLGCWTQCGVRVRVNTDENKIMRIVGNPYHPLATTNPFPMKDPVRTVLSRLGAESGLEGRATACARGNAMLEQHSNPNRVLQPLKRVGPRGSGKWETISFEQLIEEVCEGGDLFGEGHVDGLRAVRDTQTPIDPNNPEYGPRSNQLLVTDSANEGRTGLVRRFTGPAFGSVNFSNHGSYCGQSFRVGAGALYDDLVGQPHGKPDWDNALFGLFLGTAPAQSGNPFQRQGRQLAQARTRQENAFRYVVVSPILPTSSSFAAGSGNRWVPVKSGTDLSLALAIIRWIIDEERYNEEALALPSLEAMQAVNAASWSNASHLVIADPDHPRFGSFLRGTDMGWEKAEDKPDPAVVLLKSGELSPNNVTEPAQVMVEQMLAVPGFDGQEVLVRSSLAMLRDAVHQKTLAEYAELCGVPVAEIENIGREFTSYGTKAAADAHGGTMNGSGFYTAYAIVMLNALIGNLNVSGGLILDAGPFGPFGKGPKYNFADFEGKVAPKGLGLSRHRMRYEKSSEYKRKVESGQNPYPAKAPWYPAPGALSSEMLASGMEGYPYPVKIWINCASNPVYSIAGFKNMALDRLRDPKVVPLIIAVNPFINETGAYSDYIVPDTVTYESWGIGAPWADVIAKASTIRTPAVKPRVEHTADGQPINLESFFIQCALKLGLPGFGKGVLKDTKGGVHDLLTAEDFYLRGAANIAFFGGNPVDPASEDDMKLTGIDRYTDLMKTRLKDDEYYQVAMLMTRGGRFDDVDKAWDGDQLKARYTKPMQFWNEELSGMRHSMTGERLNGCPTWYPTRLADGQAMRDRFPESDWPFLMTSYKSNLMSSMSIGASRLRQVHPHNPISVNRTDAQRAGIRNGDRIRVVSPGGHIDGVAMVRDGVIAGTIAVEHGYGHTQLGASNVTIDNETRPGNRALAAGVNINDLGFADPTREDVRNVWIDWVSGGVVRQGFPARLEKIVAA
ncbi:molybdopterin dinucleotide binding domain-containing protein [Orrella sp. 11846]|uniref:molybdopterin dinucleotide binding domain-containing protein n=1 Tax=Orrella sp. 11846 TaxID=3409913 RepID=UPI003B5CE2E4